MNKPKTVQSLPLEKDILLKAEGITKIFEQGGRKLLVLNHVDIKLDAGEIVALVGPSGSGKSTLLQILGLLDKPNAGHIRIGAQAVENINDRGRTRLRLNEIGFIYQFHHLQPEFNALENVAMPQIIAGVKKDDARAKAEKLLVKLGLKERMEHQPFRLSGGEQQRVAIGRALVNDPKILLADEPTGNLDPAIAGEVFEMLVLEAKKRGIGALIATHNMDLAEQMDRILELKNGKIVPF